MANEAPERIWAASVTENYGEWQTTADGLPRPTEYIRADLAVLSSDAVAGEEPVFGWVLQEAVEFMQKGQRENNLSSTVVHSHPNEEMGWTVPLYAAPPELAQLQERVKELVKADETRARDISRLMVERDAARDALTELDQLRERVAELEKALDPFADIAGEPWADENGWTNAACQNDRICDWFGPSAFRTARSVREGGKV